jgi:CubicO group peptidase (beta-lactamase class C family)
MLNLMKKIICLLSAALLLSYVTSAFALTAGLSTSVPNQAEKAYAGQVEDYISAENAGPDQGALLETQAAVDRIAEKYGAVGAEVAVIASGFVSDTYVYGSATKGTRLMTADTKIRVASISKVVLGMVAMSLRDDGIIGLDEDISKYWGQTIKNPYCRSIPVTIRSLLSHTSSIKIYSGGANKGWKAIRRQLTSGSCFNPTAPGSVKSWGYNNYGFAVLGVTLEIAAGETVNRIADRELFAPLGINASFGSDDIDTSTLATLYYHNGTVARSVNQLKRIPGNKYPGQSGLSFAGGLLISASDLAKLVAVLANDGVYEDQQLLTPESVALMEAVYPQAVSEQPFYQGLPLRYQTAIYNQDSLYYHTGSAYGVYNLISYNPQTKNGVVVLTTGASSSKDQYGIYRICGEISDYVYSNMPSKQTGDTSEEDEPLDFFAHKEKFHFRLS